jgi:cell division septal protein FtsQ
MDCLCSSVAFRLYSRFAQLARMANIRSITFLTVVLLTVTGAGWPWSWLNKIHIRDLPLSGNYQFNWTIGLLASVPKTQLRHVGETPVRYCRA